MNSRTATALAIVLLLLVAAAAAFVLLRPQQTVTVPGPDQAATTTESVTPAPPAETPAQSTYKNATTNDIVATNPAPGATTGKAIAVTGKARGTWYFEATFPVKVLDASGKTIATGIAHAQGDWMTTEFVPFTANITIPNSYIGKATLVLSKDNPSGMPEKDASVSFPITIE